MKPDFLTSLSVAKGLPSNTPACSRAEEMAADKSKIGGNYSTKNVKA